MNCYQKLEIFVLNHVFLKVSEDWRTNIRALELYSSFNTKKYLIIFSFISGHKIAKQRILYSLKILGQNDSNSLSKLISRMKIDIRIEFSHPPWILSTLKDSLFYQHIYKLSASLLALRDGTFFLKNIT